MRLAAYLHLYIYKVSLVLVFVQECLADIKQALAFGFPEVSEYKLYRRQAWCLAQKGQKREAQEGSYPELGPVRLILFRLILVSSNLV